MNGAAKPVLLVALGGNALIAKGQTGTIAQQFKNLQIPLRQIAQLSKTYKIIITHGNGPQVGNLLIQQEACSSVPKLPLEILVAQTEGQLGYMIESTLDQELMALGIDYRPLVTLITYVVVDQNDAAFANPTKPIGPLLTKKAAAQSGYPTIQTGQGYRRVVASPRPLTIIEKREIGQLIEMDFIVICAGGGGIPVIRQGRAFNGVDAVIDKDLASACLALEVGVDLFVMATDVDGVMARYARKDQALLASLNRAEALCMSKEGHLGTGSMQPKVEAGLQFVQNGGKRAVITSINNIEKAVAGLAGTEITV